MSELEMTPEECANIVRRERSYLGFGPNVAAMTDVEVLRKGVARTRRLMRDALKNKPAFVANGALTQFNRTQMAFNRALDAAKSPK